MAERDEGDFTGRPSHPLLANAEPVPDDKPAVSLKELLSQYLDSRKAIGKGKGRRKALDTGIQQSGALHQA